MIRNMVELFKDKRVVFPRGKQKEFILTAKRAIGLSDEQLAKLLEISNRTLADWKREKFLMSLSATKIILEKTKNKMPDNIIIQNPFWYVRKGAKIGGLAVWKKYGRIGGDPAYRKSKWYEWWKKDGQYRRHPIINNPLFVKTPRYSKDLAEFVGIVLGDGGISWYQVTITLHSKDDKEYSKFVASLIKKLFNIPIGIYLRKECMAVNLVVSRRQLVRFCIEKLGLKKGNKVKQQVGVPNWIKRNKLYSIACVRGLVDTDGSIFTHQYKSERKWYDYKKLSFTSHSKPLCRFVFYVLKNNGLNPRFARGKDVCLDSIKDVKRYLKIFNSNNPKNLKKYKN